MVRAAQDRAGVIWGYLPQCHHPILPLADDSHNRVSCHKVQYQMKTAGLIEKGNITFLINFTTEPEPETVCPKKGHLRKQNFTSGEVTQTLSGTNLQKFHC